LFPAFTKGVNPKHQIPNNISYELELGKQPGNGEFEQLAQKMQSLGSSAKVKSSDFLCWHFPP
jgi:hypothetical protein